MNFTIRQIGYKFKLLFLQQIEFWLRMKKRYIKPTVLVTPVAKEALPDGGWAQVSDEELLRIRREGMQLMLEDTYVASKEVVLRRILDEWGLVPVNELSGRWNGFFTLNGSSRYLWEQFQEPVTLKSVIERARERFEGESIGIEKDVLKFVDEYLMYNLIKKVL